MQPVAPPISRRTVAAAVAERLRRRILSGALADGAPLRQDALAAELGVSRIPVREALAQLEAEGLVRLEPHRGAFVAGLSADDVAELFELRAAIEPLLLRRAVPRLAADDLDAAAAALAAFDAALAAGDADRWGELNWRFHAALYRKAGRPRMLRLAQELNNSAARCVRLHLGLAGTPPRAHNDHHRLLELCRAGAVDAAAALLARHILEAGRALSVLLARPAATEPSRCA
jgi:DNA-binding GntR family transcriptional regulator